MARAPLNVLVTGGAGYIGSHVVRDLVQAGHEVTVYDSLYSGHEWAVLGADFVRGDLAERARLEWLLGSRNFHAAIHCAGHIWVGESVKNPAKYYFNNASNAFRLFDLCAQYGIRHVVFSSTAAVYGQPDEATIDEDTPLAPINPYGASKAMAERALQDVAAASGLTFAILRYFNVAGADAQARIGEATPDNSHLVKVALETAIGLRGAMRINGTDYPTQDGTCIRDYVHVDDLANAHLLALDHLTAGGDPFVANCGYGHGFSVRQVLESVRQVTGVDFPIETGPRREGDPAILVADSRRIKALLGWTPRHDDLERIVATAWAWERRLQDMRGERRLSA
ncbi:MAG: UDP-glucose 4-epimerase GalE [Geminicoccaceae bacterium]|nr:UDP-glucose 4-epimerase GalE [Geminicoccaceae bacterium]